MAFIRAIGDRWINSDSIRRIHIARFLDGEVIFYRVYIIDDFREHHDYDMFPSEDEALECVESIINRCI